MASYRSVNLLPWLFTSYCNYTSLLQNSSRAREWLDEFPDQPCLASLQACLILVEIKRSGRWNLRVLNEVTPDHLPIDHSCQQIPLAERSSSNQYMSCFCSWANLIISSSVAAITSSLSSPFCKCFIRFQYFVRVPSF